jgi:hypothetical protein
MDSNHRCLEVGQEAVAKTGTVPFGLGAVPFFATAFAAGPRDHSVAEVGVEPTNSHQALDLAALPICVLGQPIAEAGFEPASNGL